MKKILGLDLGTNSIGWAVVNADEQVREDGSKYLKPTGISNTGSRIIPMSADILGDFDKGNSISQTAERTRLRMARRLHERALLRRERLLRVLNLMGFLPKHFADKINRYGKFTDDSEPKIAWRKNADGKMEFVFQESFHEMLEDFKRYQPELVSEQKKVPYDWTIYYLRQKALKEPLTKEEFAWVLLQFNQKRGYNQLRGEEEDEQQDKSVEYLAQKVVKVEATDQKKGDDIWYNVFLENGMIYSRPSKAPLDWEGKIKEFIVTTELEKDGTPKKDKEGNIKRSFRAPQEDDWTLLKKKTEADIDQSGKTVGCYIYEALLQKPNKKIIGKLVRTVERKFYKNELRLILEKQQSLIPELQDEKIYQACIEALYANNEVHRKSIFKPDFVNFFLNDILFYQRPLKSKKSLISNCPYEKHFYKNENDETKVAPIKCIAKSNPLFQEFRLWQFVQNLRIYQREIEIDGKLVTDEDVTKEWLKNDDDYVQLFEWLNDRQSIEQDVLLKSYFKIKKEKGRELYPYRWNYVEDKEYPCNETRATILAGLKKCEISEDFLTRDMEMSLWHLLYSVEDKKEIEQALKTFASKHSLNEKFVEVFKKIKPFTKDYGSYSEKAIKKLLALMRMGKYWKEENIDENTKNRIDKIIYAEYDERISSQTREQVKKFEEKKSKEFNDEYHLNEISKFKNLPLWLACSIIYDTKETEKWESPEAIDNYLKKFKQHSLHNPIVEQIVTETLRTVRDIWKQEGSIDEIHLELGRELKNPADVRKKMTERILQNEYTNLRIKALLTEFANPEMGIENVRPHSPSQQDILRIYEENALDNLSKNDKDYQDISKISKLAQPSKSEIIKYKCWLEQKYRSPYTGKQISLSKLFTSAYEIEHIIPQSRYFDDSFSNKVICESEVNKLKDNQLGFEFIKNHHGEKVQLSQGETVEILSVDAYENFVKEHYFKNRGKMKKLLLENIPDEFIERQLNDSRYVSNMIKGLLSNIVREKDSNEEYEKEAISKNLIPCNGAITDRLKKDWGMNDVWNSIVLPRFQRLNQITGKDCFTTTNGEGHKIPAMPIELQKGFNKKRIDHRHHAMDAIVIACTTRDHVNLLNNEAARSKSNTNRYQLQRKLRRFEKAVIDGKERDVPKEFLKPWKTFTTDAKLAIEKIIVSFKQNQRVINKTTNYYQHFNENGKKVLIKQEKGDSWAIRKSMHKATVYGEINPHFIEEKNPKDRYFATRFGNDLVSIFAGITDGQKARKIIEKITDTGIQKILLNHLKTKNEKLSNGKIIEHPEIAFSADGIDEMNKKIVELNNGKFHQPIFKVRVYEKAKKFSIGQKGAKRKKFVEADDGTNLFFAIFESKSLNKKTNLTETKRSYLTISLYTMIECQKKYGSSWYNNIESFLKESNLISDDAILQFILSPNDLVYLPKNDTPQNLRELDRKRLYKFVSADGTTANFIPCNIAKAIFSMTKDDQNKNFKEYRYGIQNEIGLGSRPSKSQSAITGEMIKETCIPIKVDRLGNIKEIGGRRL